MHDVVVVALYHFAHFPDFESFRTPLKSLMLKNEVRGTVLLAHEGINGTIAGKREGIDAVIALIKKDSRFSELVTKESISNSNPFYRTKVKLKKEIVTMGVENIDPNDIVGTYVAPRDWNDLISDPEVTVIDTRNKYEIKIGSFKNAINPQTESFREFPAYVENGLDTRKNKKVAMFCTGGIRCEKSTAYLKQQGFEEVYHLQGGILNYLKDVPEEESLWEGECFVFDNRVTVNHALVPGSYDQCHACRMPIDEKDKQSEHFQEGVSCPHCYDKHTKEQVKRYAERERQMQLAKERGESHIGEPMQDLIDSKRRATLHNPAPDCPGWRRPHCCYVLCPGQLSRLRAGKNPKTA